MGKQEYEASLCSELEANLKAVEQIFPGLKIWGTGIDNACPAILQKDGSYVHTDHLKLTGVTEKNVGKLIDNARLLKLNALRVGPSITDSWRANDNHNFSFMDAVMNACQAKPGKSPIEIIFDGNHYGLPAEMHFKHKNEPYYQNPEFPYLHAEFMAANAKRYPNIKCFTPINEAGFLAHANTFFNMWNEHMNSEHAFVNAIKNCAKAHLLSQAAILEVRKNLPTLFVPCESTHLSIAMTDSPHVLADVDRANTLRFLFPDLIFGSFHPETENYLLSNGMSNQELEWFSNTTNQLRHKTNTVLGINYYFHSVREVNDHSQRAYNHADPCQLEQIVSQYSHRYPFVPILLSEVNGIGHEGWELADKSYWALDKLIKAGFPVTGMIYYSLDHQTGWCDLLMDPTSKKDSNAGLFNYGELNPVGSLFGLCAIEGLPNNKYSL